MNLIVKQEQYSFVSQSSAQVLDHALTSHNLNDLARRNFDVPENLVNNTFNAMRASDHDGIVLFITLYSGNDIIND